MNTVQRHTLIAVTSILNDKCVNGKLTFSINQVGDRIVLSADNLNDTRKLYMNPETLILVIGPKGGFRTAKGSLKRMLILAK